MKARPVKALSVSAAVVAVTWGVASVVGTSSAATATVSVALNCKIMDQATNATVPFQVTTPDSVTAGDKVTGTLVVDQAIAANTVNLINAAGISSIDMKAEIQVGYAGVAAGPAMVPVDIKGMMVPAKGAWNVHFEQPLSAETTGAGEASVALGNMTMSITPHQANGDLTQFGVIAGTCATQPGANTVFAVPVKAAAAAVPPAASASAAPAKP